MQRRFWIGWLATNLLVAPVAVLAGELPATATLNVRGILQPAEEITLRSPIDARVATVHVEVGQEVAAGQILVELDPTQLERGLVQATAGRQQASAEKTLADRGIDRVGRAEEQLRTDLGIARSLLNRADTPAGPPGRRGRDASRKSIMRAPLQESADERAATAETEAQKALLQARMRRSLVESFREELDSLEAKAQVAQKTAEGLLERYAAVAAPSAGTVVNCTLRPQEWVSRGQPVATLIQTNRVKAQLWIPAESISAIPTGTPVSVRMDHADSRAYAGEVSRISVQPHPRTGQYLAEVVLKKDDARLRPGMLVEATIGPVPQKAPAASP